MFRDVEFVCRIEFYVNSGPREKETDIKNSYKIITFTLFNFKLDVFSGRIDRQRQNFVTSPI